MRISRDVQFSAIPAWIVRHPSLSDRAVRLWCVLDTFATNAGQVEKFAPSRKKLSVIAGCSVSSIDRALSELVSMGALSVVHRQTAHGDADTNSYRLNSQFPEGVAAPVTTPTVTGEERGGFTSDDRVAAPVTTIPKEPRSSKPSLSKTASGTERRRDPLFDALVEAMGYEEQDLTAPMRRTLGVASSQIRPVLNGTDPRTEVLRRAAIYRLTQPGTLTPTALAKWWPSCDQLRMPESTHPNDVRRRALRVLAAQREEAANGQDGGRGVRDGAGGRVPELPDPGRDA